MESKLTDHSNYIGNKQILEQYKIAFLCSRKCPAEIILKSYDWAIEQREKGICVVSGFHSKIENDVLHYLLKGNQPIILALARGLKKRLEPALQEALNKNRLLLISPFGEHVKRATIETANQRNRLMAELADEIFVAYAAKGGNIERLLADISVTGKEISSFKIG
ncbi:MAG: DNA-binding protein [Candidatus Brocadia carolinensis]|uniref:DNA-binding protein n=1 Tax=Candidatus Brocadia carolinensis TaxID=1004156 RepID=A0A1V4AP31_9BACT|nr:MAG: DNA-binding protein [Candidatus Brocadia caroliniensis]QOJ07252.1 MAG: DNA-processing protein DprA [Planctomycetia bacterium]TVL95974.1 MAG: DNA-binding protein [Candidatus Brocadia sp. BL1]HQU31033.1 DNA-processing protein DprA [Candidatus Brocadia sapporoensis]